MEISRFKITKLNRLYNYDVEFKDNALILIGENGTGKSTILTILNYVISRQWEKLTDYSFESISLTLNNDELIFHKSDLRYFGQQQNSSALRHRVSSRVINIIKRNNFSLDEIYNNEEVKFRIKTELAERYGMEITYTGLDRIVSELLFNDDVNSSIMLDIDKKIKVGIRHPIIFLPTYRRIEHELSSIFPELERLQNRDYNYRRKNSRLDDSYSELVEFGMGDINAIIANSLEMLEQSFRTGLKKLMSDFLKDILLHKHEQDEKDKIKVEQSEIEKILARIDAETLSGDIKDEIKATILNLSDNDHTIKSGSDRVISYFISKLIEFHQVQSKQETSILKFIDTCNKYLVNKKLTFNSISFKINLFSTEKIIETTLENEIKLDVLSSGEKQIVSLFAHLFLTTSKDKYIIFIDEPELSLSVFWQKKFLEDIKNSDKCNGLFAVTHSPFIYDNSLDTYARSINEFMEYAG